MIKTLLEAQMEKMVVQMDEVFARQRRIETLLYRVAEHVGMKQDSNKGKPVLRTSTSVEVPGWDVSVGHIKRVLEDTGNYPPTDLVGVYLRDTLVAEIDFIS